MTAQGLETLFDQLFPLNRSLTGEGVRESLRILQPHIALNVHEKPSGSQVFDWTIPAEYNVQEAYITTPHGERICDFATNNLHLMGYSQPYEGEMSLDALKPHLHTLPQQPDAIPYITSYYAPRWGFCISQNQLDALPTDGIYTIKIKTTHNPKGSLTFADAVLQGETDEEIFFSTYICHPSMASNELSGVLVATQLYQLLAAMPKRRYTYRFAFVPETIGAINYLHQHGEHLKNKLVAGYVITCVGNEAPFTYKQARTENCAANQIAAHILAHKHPNYHSIRPFFPFGSDERQYCSPAFNLPVGSLMRTMYGEYAEYHTSLDNKAFVRFEAMHQTAQTYYDICKAHELNQNFYSQNPHCEPQLGKRNLYNSLSTKQQTTSTNQTMMWLLAYADGKNSLLHIAQKANMCILDFEETIQLLIENQLIKA